METFFKNFCGRRHLSAQQGAINLVVGIVIIFTTHLGLAKYKLYHPFYAPLESTSRTIIRFAESKQLYQKRTKAEVRLEPDSASSSAYIAQPQAKPIAIWSDINQNNKDILKVDIAKCPSPQSSDSESPTGKSPDEIFDQFNFQTSTPQKRRKREGQQQYYYQKTKEASAWWVHFSSKEKLTRAESFTKNLSNLSLVQQDDTLRLDDNNEIGQESASFTFNSKPNPIQIPKSNQTKSNSMKLFYDQPDQIQKYQYELDRRVFPHLPIVVKDIQSEMHIQTAGKNSNANSNCNWSEVGFQDSLEIETALVRQKTRWCGDMWTSCPFVQVNSEEEIDLVIDEALTEWKTQLQNSNWATLTSEFDEQDNFARANYATLTSQEQDSAAVDWNNDIQFKNVRFKFILPSDVPNLWLERDGGSWKQIIRGVIISNDNKADEDEDIQFQHDILKPQPKTKASLWALIKHQEYEDDLIKSQMFKRDCSSTSTPPSRDSQKDVSDLISCEGYSDTSDIVNNDNDPDNWDTYTDTHCDKELHRERLKKFIQHFTYKQGDGDSDDKDNKEDDWSASGEDETTSESEFEANASTKFRFKRICNEKWWKNEKEMLMRHRDEAESQMATESYPPSTPSVEVQCWWQEIENMQMQDDDIIWDVTGTGTENLKVKNSNRSMCAQAFENCCKERYTYTAISFRNELVRRSHDFSVIGQSVRVHGKLKGKAGDSEKQTVTEVQSQMEAKGVEKTQQKQQLLWSNSNNSKQQQNLNQKQKQQQKQQQQVQDCLDLEGTVVFSEIGQDKDQESEDSETSQSPRKVQRIFSFNVDARRQVQHWSKE